MLDSLAPSGTPKTMPGSTNTMTRRARPARFRFQAAAKDKRCWSFPLTMFIVGCLLVAFMDPSLIMVGMVSFACLSAYISNIIGFEPAKTPTNQ